ncbi:hypothetical protein TTHERM_00049130 (macronuclear) [Tetrahymena thermophila SB210]|uniref:Uncharacterized protein n=1 Tax=Tetrahymena thermophila (strain SB210) TaxID=312017 RepID=Q23D78_TETTS|nr:hypothetical protein TTHERM_00049130 [Tetrahymena thermophila SB210]EAR94615.1 hypothetical protein TTHERM_00049130 [Tetrahymena thermophila SB210]|eukprot:XP_001014808.1 hypothetical protein TTHERM_00049130 [Tetrahymena thermophila SB210]
MGNNFCSCKSGADTQNDIVYTDSSYNIWDNNPIISQNSLNSQFSFSANINNKVTGLTKEQYLPQQSPRNDQSTSQGFQDRLSQSQINMKLEQIQEMVKKQHSIIQEETEVETIVELPKDSSKEAKHAQPSFFSQKKLSQEDFSEKNNEKINLPSCGNQSEYQSPKEGQQQSKISQQNIQNQQGNINTQVTTDQDRVQTNPQYSLKYIKYDNNYYDEDRIFSMQFNDQKNENQIQNK